MTDKVNGRIVDQDKNEGQEVTWFQDLMIKALRGQEVIQPWSEMTRRCGIGPCRHDGTWLGFIGPRGTAPTLARVCHGHHWFANDAAGREDLRHCFYAGVRDNSLDKAMALMDSLSELGQTESALKDALEDVSKGLAKEQAGSQARYLLIAKLRATKHALSNFYFRQRQRERRSEEAGSAA